MTSTQIKAVRLFAGLKRADFANLLDVAPETVRRWETGAAAIPPRVAACVMTRFDIEPESLLDDAEPSALAARLKERVASAPHDALPPLAVALRAYLFEYICNQQDNVN